MNQDDLMSIGEAVFEQARKIFQRCDAEQDFCIQSVGGFITVFGGTNRLLYSPSKGFVPDLGYCTAAFLEKYGLFTYGAPIANKRNALVPTTRLKVCEHDHVFYQGAIPCTGPKTCPMCGLRFAFDEELESARDAARKESQKRERKNHE